MRLNVGATVTALKMAISGIIAMTAMIFFHLNFGYWAVVTVAAMTSYDESSTLVKGTMRLAGTLIGAIFGYVIASITSSYSLFSMLLFFIVILGFMLISLQKNSVSYAGIIAGVTTAIIIGVDANSNLLVDVSVYRTCEVILGILITAAISLIFQINVIKLTQNSFFSRSSFHMNRQIFISALRIALTATATYAFWYWLKIPGGFWITISCLFIMEENMNNTMQKGWLRFLAHIFAAAIGLTAALLYGQNAWLIAVTLFLGFFFCGYIIGQKKSYSSLGNTTGIALSIMLLAGFNQHDITHTVFIRFFNVCAGIAIGTVMTQYFLPTSK